MRFKELWAKTVNGGTVSASVSVEAPKVSTTGNLTLIMDGNELRPGTGASSTSKLGTASNYFQDAYIQKLHVAPAGTGTAFTVGIDLENGSIAPAGGSTNVYYLGKSNHYWTYAYLGSNTCMIGNAAASKLGFFGAAAIARQTLSTTSQNMGYSSATASNYLTVLNNIAGILKNKYGLIG